MRLKLRSLAFACVPVLMVLIACDSSGPKFTQIKVNGTVTDVGTGAPIAGASVAIVHYPNGPSLVGTSLQSMSTDASGRYALTHIGCAIDPYVQVFAAGYFFDGHEIGCIPEEQTLDFQLTREP